MGGVRVEPAAITGLEQVAAPSVFMSRAKPMLACYYNLFLAQAFSHLKMTNADSSFSWYKCCGISVGREHFCSF
jgi:hypothetical protein